MLLLPPRLLPFHRRRCQPTLLLASTTRHLAPEDDVAPDDILAITTRSRRDAAERAAGLDMASVLKAAAINPNKESLEPVTDASEPFLKGLGTVDALLWRSAARSSASPSGTDYAVVTTQLRRFVSSSRRPCLTLALSADQLATLQAAAAARPGFAHPRQVGGLSKAAMYIAVDGRKMHVRSILATLCGRPRTSKDRVLRVQQQPIAISQPDEGDAEPEQEESA